MTEFISNEKEKERGNHNIPTNIYEIIGPKCQLENVMSFLRRFKMERETQTNSYNVPSILYCNQVVTKNK